MIKRDTILKLLDGGKIATVTFIKRSTGEERVMNCRLGVTKHLKGGTKPFEDEDHNLITVFDMTKKGYRSLSCENILRIAVDGAVIEAKK